MRNLIVRLVTVSGGWENFLYETLRDLCLDITESGGKVDLRSLDDCADILAAYTSAHTKVDGNCTEPDVQKVAEVSKKKVEVSKPADVTAENEPEPEEPEPTPLPEPVNERCGVQVDPYAGACQGQLPLPAGHILVNKHLILVSTSNDSLELGRASLEGDGQIRGKGVSGHIGNSGFFRMVFTDAKIGAAAIHYQIQQQEGKDGLPEKDS